MSSQCFFCKQGAKNLATLSVNPPLTSKVYEDDTCYAILELEQSAWGYTLVILKEHKETILDENITSEQNDGFWKVVRKIGNVIKRKLGAENVYVCSLCDGVSHFHVHLIPRYKWTDEHKKRYIELFKDRDGERSVKLATAIGLIGGFWYIADTERNFHKTDFMKLPKDEQLRQLAKLAKELAEEISKCIH